jgi:hypothetical protein
MRVTKEATTIALLIGWKKRVGTSKAWAATAATPVVNAAPARSVELDPVEARK